VTVQEQSQTERRILLQPAVVKGKGRPKGAKGKQKGDGLSSTRRHLSLFEHEAAAENAPPSSTAPPRLELASRKRCASQLTQDFIIVDTEVVQQLSTTAAAVLRGARSKWDTENKSQAELSTTALALLRGASTMGDLYEAGTERERAYMRSLKIDKLGSAVSEAIEEVFVDIDVYVEDNKTQEVFIWEEF
jgi:hypothetical protein